MPTTDVTTGGQPRGDRVAEQPVEVALGPQRCDARARLPIEDGAQRRLRERAERRELVLERLHDDPRQVRHRGIGLVARLLLDDRDDRARPLRRRLLVRHADGRDDVVRPSLAIDGLSADQPRDAVLVEDGDGRRRLAVRAGCHRAPHEDGQALSNSQAHGGR